MKRSAIALAALAALAPSAVAGTLDTVKSRGALVCGGSISQGVAQGGVRSKNCSVGV
jgi:hypothetical protein